MKKIYRPFWSYDVAKTEIWLSQMARNGFLVKKLNRWTRCFYFNEEKANVRTYRIAYDKLKSSTIPKTLQNEGWETAFTTGKWHVTTNSQPEQTIKNSPIRDGIIKHNQTITYLFFGLLFYLASVLIAPISLAYAYLFTDESIFLEDSPYWVVTYLFFTLVISLIVLGIYSIIAITNTNKSLRDPLAIESSQRSNKINKQKEQELKHSGRWVTKIRLAWMYSPDKLEHWLESMEQRGFNLYRVNPLGTIFHFTKGEPRHIAYRIDYQRQPPESYFFIHKEAGWHDRFVSSSNLENWTIWSQEYREDQERPLLYSDYPTRIKQAKKMIITYTALFLPFTLLYIYFLINSFNQQTELFLKPSWGTLVFILCIGIYGSFMVKLWTYYMRLKKQATVE